LRLRPSRGYKSWRNAHRLNALGIRTVKPVALLECRFGILRGKAYFISEYVKGIRGCDYFDEAITTTQKWQKAIHAIVALLHKFKVERIYHRDFQFGNMLMVDNQPLLLDLDHLAFYRFNSWWFRIVHRKDINQFKKFLGNNKKAKQLFTNALKIRK